MRVKPVFTALIVAGISWGTLSPALAAECTHAARTSGQCPTVDGSLSPGGVTLTGTQVIPGGPGQSSLRVAGKPPPPRDPVLGSAQCQVKVAGLCQGTSPSREPVEEAQPTPPRSMSDVASFAPDGSGIGMQPEGWSLPLLPLNLYSLAGETREQGELLGWPIEVRFTPVSFAWTYGDGKTQTHQVPGAPRSTQFSPSPTSHVYSLSGDYVASVLVTYVASYRFGEGPFVSLPGELTRFGGARTVEVLSVTPVLVNRGCHSETLVEGRC